MYSQISYWLWLLNCLFWSVVVVCSDFVAYNLSNLRNFVPWWVSQNKSSWFAYDVHSSCLIKSKIQSWDDPSGPVTAGECWCLFPRTTTRVSICCVVYVLASSFSTTYLTNTCLRGRTFYDLRHLDLESRITMLIVGFLNRVVSKSLSKEEGKKYSIDKCSLGIRFIILHLNQI